VELLDFLSCFYKLNYIKILLVAKKK